MIDPDPVIVFMGSPDFAVPTLQALNANYRVAGVVTQPDRPAGRGRTLTSPPIKELADALGLPVIQPNRLREPEAMDAVRSWSPDLIVVAAFGQILRSAILDLPRFGCINVHASLLPRLARRCADPGCNSGWRFRNRRDDHAHGRRDRHRTNPEPALDFHRCGRNSRRAIGPPGNIRSGIID